MIKVRAKESFTLARFNEIKNLKRAEAGGEGFIGVNDEFECEKDLAKYLLNDVGYENPVDRAVVEVIEIVPEKSQQEAKTEVKEEKKKAIKKTTKKK